MHVNNTPYTSPWSPIQVVAQAYGMNTYSGNSYNGNTDTSTTTAPQAPSTGFLAEPPLVTVPLLLIVAILVGATSFFITRAIRRHRDK